MSRRLALSLAVLLGVVWITTPPALGARASPRRTDLPKERPAKAPEAKAPDAARAGGGVRVDRDLRYAVHDGVPLLLDVYVPAGRRPFPGLLLIPGGKWREASKDRPSNVEMATRLAREGFVVFNLNYRTAPAFVYPAQLHDVRAAVRWVRRHAGRYGVDPGRLGAIGPSAGGHLAALLATVGSGPVDSGPRVRVAVSWSGPMHLPSLLRQVPPHVEEVVSSFLGCDPGSACERAAGASPARHVDPSDAPLFLATGTEEVIPLSQATTMARALEDAGVPFEVFPVRGDSHGYGYAFARKAFDPSVAFLLEWIDGDGTRRNPEAAPSRGERERRGPVERGAGRSAADGDPALRKDRDGSASPPLGVLALVALAVPAAALVLAATRRRRGPLDGSVGDPRP